MRTSYSICAPACPRYPLSNFQKYLTINIIFINSTPHKSTSYNNNTITKCNLPTSLASLSFSGAFSTELVAADVLVVSACSLPDLSSSSPSPSLFVPDVAAALTSFFNFNKKSLDPLMIEFFQNVSQYLTDRVRSTRGGYIFSLSVSSHLGEGGGGTPSS